MSKSAFVIKRSEREELVARMRSRTLPAEDGRRARTIVMLADGESFTSIQEAVGCNRSYITRWKERFETGGVDGLYSRHTGRAPSKDSIKLEAKILAKTQRKPSDGSTHWSTRKLAGEMGIDHMRVARVWARARLKPHRVDHYILSDDPDFESKAADIIGLYMDPPQHAAVFCVDEKTAIQALDRLDPVLPLSPGRAEKHGFEYYRHGTLSLYAALDVKTGQVHGKTARRHTSEDFLAFITQLVERTPGSKEIHIVLDNLSAHKTKSVAEFLDQNPRVRFHFTPTYSSWLNQVEIWFAKIQRDVIDRGVFTSVADLSRKLMKYIRLYGKSAKPFRWTYTDVSRRIK